MENTDKVELLKAAKGAVETLYGRVHNAGLQAFLDGGEMCREIGLGMDMPLGFAASYLRQVLEVVENPESGKKYSVFRPFKRAGARKAAEAAEKALASLPVDKIQEALGKANVAMEGDLEGSVNHYANALTHKRGQKMTDEDTAKMQPSLRVMEVLMAIGEAQKAYRPAYA